MKVTTDLLKPVQKFIKPGFEHQAKGTICNPFNLATSYNKHHALQGEYPNISVDYTKVKLSSGVLPIAKDLQISKVDNGLQINWNPTHAWEGDQYDDLVMVALYHPNVKQASLHLNAGKREQGSCFINISDENHLNEPIEAYLCFKSADGERISDSIYLGNINGSYEAKVEKEINMKHTKLQTRFEQVKAKYQAAEALYQKTGFNKNALKQMEKEYQALQGRLENLPGKPV